MLKTNLSVSIKPPLREALKAAAEREELSVSSLVRRTLRQHFLPPPAPTAERCDDHVVAA